MQHINAYSNSPDFQMTAIKHHESPYSTSQPYPPLSHGNNDGEVRIDSNGKMYVWRDSPAIWSDVPDTTVELNIQPHIQTAIQWVLDMMTKESSNNEIEDKYPELKQKRYEYFQMLDEIQTVEKLANTQEQL